MLPHYTFIHIMHTSIVYVITQQLKGKINWESMLKHTFKRNLRKTFQKPLHLEVKP